MEVLAQVSLIQTEGLTKRFGSVTAVDALTVDVRPGVTGLVGANGAGKSTLLKILLGLLPATEGTASVLGLDVATDGPAIRERVGYMPEHDCLPPDVVRHRVRRAHGPDVRAADDGRPRARRRHLRHVGLYEERYRPMGGYSTGMRQRVKLAQALVHDPGLVLLDEPTNGLDPAGRDDMLELIRRIGAEFGISVIVTSHLLGELERVCDGIVVIDGGRLLRHSTTAVGHRGDARGHGRGRRRPRGAAASGSAAPGVAVRSDGKLLHVDVGDADRLRPRARRRRRARPRPGADGAPAAPDDRDLHRQSPTGRQGGAHV